MPRLEKIKCGPLEFVREDNGGRECWDVVVPADTELTCWAVKHYSDIPDDETGFSGWRVVGGGPFVDAGGWTNRDDAIIGATPWIVKQWREEIGEAKKEAARRDRALTAFLDELNAGNG